MLWVQEEIDLVKKLNQKNDLTIRNTLGLEPHEHFAVFVDKQVIGAHSWWKKVSPKSDLYIAKWIVDNIHELDYIINDSCLNHYNLEPLLWYWISVKMSSSKSYTITKMWPSTFHSVFWSLELGAWVSIYCQRLEELYKNISVVRWRQSSIDWFINYYNNCWVNISRSDFSNPTIISQEKFTRIKHFANSRTRDMIDKNEEIKSFIFQGKGSFEAPYYCSRLYHHWMLVWETFVPYQITTWNGRSKGKFTVVIKPQTTVI